MSGYKGPDAFEVQVPKGLKGLKFWASKAFEDLGVSSSGLEGFGGLRSRVPPFEGVGAVRWGLCWAPGCCSITAI